MGQGFCNGMDICVRAARSVALLFALGLVLSSSAGADVADICPEGSAAGQCKAPDGVAVDEETGEVYLTDTGNFRIDVFDEEGAFLHAFGWDVIPSGAPGDTGTGLETCTEATGCKAGSAGSGAGQLKGNGPDAIAVDNDPASLSQHAVYLVDQGNSRLQKFTPAGSFACTIGGLNPPAWVGVGPSGVIYVADSKGTGENRLRKYNPDCSFSVEIALPEVNETEVKALAVDRLSGDFYAVSRAVEGVHRYKADGTHLSKEQQFARALATDGEGHLFVADRSSPPFTAPGSDLGGIYEYDASGNPVRTFYGNGTLEGNVESLAPRSSATGDLFVVEASAPRRLDQIAFPAPGPVVLPNAAQTGESAFSVGLADTKARPVGSIRATFRTRVNPEGKATKVHFEYVDDATYQKDVAELGAGHGFDHAKRGPEEAAEDPLIGADSGIWRAHEALFDLACPDPQVELAEGKCLEAETAYHLRAVAENADGDDVGPEASFETLPPIELGPAWSTSVGSESARLHAQLNPHGVPATARFEYVDDAGYQKDKGEGGDGFAEATATEELDFGEGDETTSRSILLHHLAPGTTYRYRYTATNFFGEFEEPEVRSFTTLSGALAPKDDCPNQAFRAGASAPLPDCRAYELVSPLEKGNADVLSSAGSLGGVPAEQAEVGGNALAYTSFRAFGDAVSSPIISQYLASRDPASGWSTHSLNPPLGGGNLYEAVYVRPIFKGFSEDLCSAWMIQNSDLPLVEGAPPGVPSLYRQLNCEDGKGCPVAGQLTEDCYELLTTAPPPGFTREGQESTFEGGTGSKYYPGADGWSEDGKLTVFKAAAALTPEASIVGVGKSLSCQLGSFTADGTTRVFQWLRNGASIGGATSETYATAAADEGKAVQCRVRATNEENDENGGKVGAATTSNPAQVVAPRPETMPPIAPSFIPPPESSAPLILKGAAGQVLTCDPREAGWRGEPSSFAYQWYRNGLSLGAGATASTYTVIAANLNSAATFQCAITATNAGGSVTAFSANLTTTEPGPEPPAPQPRAFVLDVYRVYAQKEGQLALVSVQPDGEAFRTHASGGTRALGDHGGSDGNSTNSVAGAVSTDGERVFFSATSKEPPEPTHQSVALFVPEVKAEGESRLYLRVHPLAPQSAVEEVAPGEFHCSEAAKACTVPISKGEARFIAADPKASVALYLEGEELFEADVGKALAYEAEPQTKIAGKVLGVMGASEEASRAYLVSEEVCSSEPNSEEEEAQAGEPNLYLYEAGESCAAGGMDFVAALGEGDIKELGELSPVDQHPFQRRSRVSPDGLHAAFMSREPLTDYDNTDAVGGAPASEVFLYDAAEGKLRCVSCNPSGGRPQGGNVRTALEPLWVAAQIPGWATQWHPSRALSKDGGRLFFESFEGLVPRDANGRLDVYEWEEDHGKAQCEAVGAERYVASSEGCLSLISSGTSAADSTFIDASADGSDVFFHTASSLVGIDYGLVDIYDARVGGGFHEPIVNEEECQGEACQSQPAPPAGQTPSSSAFEGEGDVPPKRSCPKGKRRVRRAGKALCLKKPHRAKHHRKGKGRR